MDKNLYQTWYNINSRCNNPKVWNYKYYGARGIKVSWKNKEEFFKDMEENYKKGLQLDRIDNNKGYSKDNCKWVTHEVNSQHRSSTIHLFDYKNMKISLAKSCRLLGMTKSLQDKIFN